MSLFTFIHDIQMHWVLALSALGLCHLIASAFYNLYLNPLAKYPGPFFSKISALPSFYYATTGQRHIWIWQCHQIYGDTFRYHPNGVLLNSPSAFRAIYGAKANVKKSKFYEVWPRNSQDHNTLNTVDKERHAQRRRVLNLAFSEKSLRSAEAFVVQHLDRWCELLLHDTREEDWTPAKNMAVLAHQLVFDIMGDLCFGKSFDIKEPGSNPFRDIPYAFSEYMKFMYIIGNIPMINFWVWLKPRGLDAAMAYLTPKNILDYFVFVNASVMKRTEEEEQLQNLNSEEASIRKDMFHYLFNTKAPDTGLPAFSDEELTAEANLLLIAGTDTTANAISALWFYLTRNNRVYRKLATEIRTTFDSTDDIVGGAKLSSCHYLRACIDEALRMAPTGIVSEMSREVLPGGLDIHGNVFPEGVKIGTSSWAIMYHEQYFSDPYVYRPERWIVDEKSGVTADDVALARSPFNPFSVGPGNCPGQKLAMLELQLMTARVLYRMDIQCPSGDNLGGGSPELGWGRRDKNQFQLEDAFVSLVNGPMVQFKKRVLSKLE